MCQLVDMILNYDVEAFYQQTTSHFFCAPPASLHVHRPPLLSGRVDDLLISIASGGKPTSLLKQLYSLKAFVQQKDTARLEKALEELYNNSSMSAGQWSINQYFIYLFFQKRFGG